MYVRSCVEGTGNRGLVKHILLVLGPESKHRTAAGVLNTGALAICHGGSIVVVTAFQRIGIMTIRLVRLLVMGGAALLASCALFNPYVQSIAPETKTATGSQLASKIRMELQGKTNGLAYWQSGSSLALAGALGLGGYKAVTAGNGHQVAALAAGSASLYGFSAAQYKPTREQLYHRGVQAVMCVESIYERASLEEGNELIRRIAQLKAGSGAVSITNAYSLYGAISRAKAFDRVYKEKLVEIVAALNNYLAALQPAPEVTYRIISDAIGSRRLFPSMDVSMPSSSSRRPCWPTRPMNGLRASTPLHRALTVMLPVATRFRGKCPRSKGCHPDPHWTWWQAGRSAF
jgi:hypothetical protein